MKFWRLVLVGFWLTSCAECSDALRQSSGAEENNSLEDSERDDLGDRGGGNRDPNNEPNYGGDPAGVPGECETDDDCLVEYEGTIWPFAEPSELECKTDSSLGLGHCSECEIDEDCPDEHRCHHAQFCLPEDNSIGGGCARDADCKVVNNVDAGPVDWSPRHPIRCRPYRDLGPQPNNDVEAGRRWMDCRQCTIDIECGKNGKCFHGVCQDFCESDEDCPGGAEEWHCTDVNLCYPR